MFRTFAALAALTVGLWNPVAAQSRYQIACGTESSVMETSTGALQFHNSGDFTLFDENTEVVDQGRWTYARNGDYRVFIGGKSYVFKGMAQEKCDRFF